MNATAETRKPMDYDTFTLAEDVFSATKRAKRVRPFRDFLRLLATLGHAPEDFYRARLLWGGRQ